MYVCTITTAHYAQQPPYQARARTHSNRRSVKCIVVVIPSVNLVSLWLWEGARHTDTYPSSWTSSTHRTEQNQIQIHPHFSIYRSSTTVGQIYPSLIYLYMILMVSSCRVGAVWSQEPAHFFLSSVRHIFLHKTSHNGIRTTLGRHITVVINSVDTKHSFLLSTCIYAKSGTGCTLCTWLVVSYRKIVIGELFRTRIFNILLLY